MIKKSASLSRTSTLTATVVISALSIMVLSVSSAVAATNSHQHPHIVKINSNYHPVVHLTGIIESISGNDITVSIVAGPGHTQATTTVVHGAIASSSAIVTIDSANHSRPNNRNNQRTQRQTPHAPALQVGDKVVISGTKGSDGSVTSSVNDIHIRKLNARVSTSTTPKIITSSFH